MATSINSRDYFTDTLTQVYERFHSWQYPQPPQSWTPLAADLPADFPTDLDEGELSKALPQVFKSPGGKKWAARKIVKLLPPHKRYVEPFCGSAAVFWQKQPAPEEVLNDLRPNLIDTFRYIRDADDFTPLLEKDWVASREKFMQLRHWQPQETVDKAYRYLWLARATLLNAESDSGYSPWMASKNIHPPMVGRLQKWKARLQGVTLLEKDASAVIQYFDDPYTLFYLDPPYPKGRDPHFYGPNEYTMADLHKLFALCAGLKGRVLMSLNAKSLPKEGLPETLGWRKIMIWYPTLPTSVKTMAVSREGKLRMEVLVHNYLDGLR